MNRITKTVSTFVSVKARVNKRAKWFVELRNALKERCNYDGWQSQDSFHQTLVFINNDTCIPALKDEFSKVIPQHRAFTQKIDKLDAFTTEHEEHVICLTSTQICPEMENLVKDIRKVVDNKGINFDKREFLLHITLGRISTKAITLEELKSILSTIELPTFNLLMEKVEYRYFGRTKPRYVDPVIESWTLKPKLDEERIRRAFANAASNIQLAIDPDM